MKIGVVGSGRIGGLIGTLWSRAGHEVLFSSRHPESLAALVEAAGNSTRSGTPDQAISFGDVILLSIPFGELPEFSRTKREALSQKIVLETGNPNLKRDGEIARSVLESGRGTGVFLREWFAGVRIVRVFNTVWHPVLAKEAHRAGPRVGIPLASDDEAALRIASNLVVDSGFDPVVVGALDRAREFDMGTAVYDTGMSGPEVRRALNL
ncbi:NADPH-dependent F420 reductase [Acidisarcina polymorpha]|nr:NAD(P)-binding domain-containing protein [Acidisarcina polymorpha]